MVPHVYAFITYNKLINQRAEKSEGKGSGAEWQFDTSQPRTFLSKIDTNPHPSLTRDVRAQLMRAEAASANGFEQLGFFSAAVVAANVSLIVVHANEGRIYADELWYINALSLGYLGSRCLYNWVYIAGVVGPVRGLPFYTCLACATTLYIRAGNALRVLVK